MPSQTIHELREFHHFLTEKVGSNEIDLSPEEALDEWRRLHPPTQGLDDDVAAIQEALDDVAKGDAGMQFDQFDREFRKRHNLPA
jgi:hypothetical protein